MLRNYTDRGLKCFRQGGSQHCLQPKFTGFSYKDNTVAITHTGRAEIETCLELFPDPKPNTAGEAVIEMATETYRQHGMPLLPCPDSAHQDCLRKKSIKAWDSPRILDLTAKEIGIVGNYERHGGALPKWRNV
jgi:hypothetical protein